MSTKRWINEKTGHIVCNFGHAKCEGDNHCDSCPVPNYHNGKFDKSCGNYADTHMQEAMSALGYKEIFELDNYKYSGGSCAMLCHGLDEANRFSKFLNQNRRSSSFGGKWPILDCLQSDDVYFMFNMGLSSYAPPYEYGCDTGVILSFKDFHFEMLKNDDENTKENDDMKQSVFTKDDLKAGYQVVVRKGFVYLVLPDDDGDLVLAGRDGLSGWNPLSRYTNDLCVPTNDGYDIVEVYGQVHCGLAFYRLLTKGHRRELLWKREGPKDMTLAEVEKALGYPVKIVKEK